THNDLPVADKVYSTRDCASRSVPGATAPMHEKGAVTFVRISLEGWVQPKPLSGAAALPKAPGLWHGTRPDGPGLNTDHLAKDREPLIEANEDVDPFLKKLTRSR